MCPVRRASRIRKPCARLTLFNRGTYLNPIMGLRWLIILLLSATLVSAPTVRPVAAIAMGMSVGASSQLSCGPHALVTPGTTAPIACAKSLACIAMDEVRLSFTPTKVGTIYGKCSMGSKMIRFVVVG